MKHVVLGLLFASCLSSVYADEALKSVQVSTQNNQGRPVIESTKAIHWYRNSAERNAIYHEVFLMAENVIQNQVKTLRLKKHQWGIIADIDETLLDNSQWNYDHDVLGKTASWEDYAALANSHPIPGAKEFINHIHAMGGYINLISNRHATLQAATEKNLKELGIYFDQVLLNTSTSAYWYPDKNPRFTAVIKGVKPSILPAQNIVAWLGDNIQDFPGIKQSEIIGKSASGEAYAMFGVKYFALPNPMYGSWEGNKLN